MWGWLNGLLDGIRSVWEGVSQIPSKVISGFNAGLESLFNGLEKIWEEVKAIPNAIGEYITDVFVPDTDVLRSIMNDASASISSKFGIQEFNFDNFTSNSTQPSDIESEYYISGVGTFKLKFFDTSFLIKGVEYFRPFIRGFLVLLLIIYNWRQGLSFIGQDIGASNEGNTPTMLNGSPSHSKLSAPMLKGGKE